MDKKALMLAVFLAVALTAAVWTYKGQNFQDNQVVVYLTGSELAAGAEAGELPVEFREIPEIETGKPVEVQINGVTTSCQLTSFNGVDSKAIGTECNGRLENAAKLPINSPHYQVRSYTLKKDDNRGAHFGTTEFINTVEITTCAVSAKTGVKLTIADISKEDGGSLSRHNCHEAGREADIQLVCAKPGGTLYGCDDGDRFDPAGNWIFVKTLAEKTPIKRILLDQRLIDKLRNYAFNIDSYTDYNLKRQIFSNLLVHKSGHYDHFHIRIWCSKKDPQCREEYVAGLRGPAGTELEVEQEEQSETPPTLSGVASDEELLAKAELDPNKCLYFENLNPIISYCSAKYGINENLVKAIMYAESGSGCGYRGGKPKDVSSAGARGLLQVLDSAVEDVNNDRLPAEKINYNVDIDKPSINICAGTQYLAILWQRYGNNFNIRTVDDLIQSYRGGPVAYKNPDDQTSVWHNANKQYLENVKNGYSQITGQSWPPEVNPPDYAVSRRGNA